ncbi:transporter, putative [Candidatus Moduliflexus flocculans]|uniref:Transporter, putative n=1 Tax=Candidatus Moduliflexus flocculans TaxID=1499966 RepID=A0A0S6VWJ3_9BACT|nr:transporter, putative [Candidatus Moduliflexus flocculans]
MGSSVSDCSCQEPTPNPSPEGSVRSFVSNRLRNMSYLDGITSNVKVLDQIRLNANKIGLDATDLELLEEVMIENQQCQKQAEIYLNILTGLMDARSSIVNNNLNLLFKRLTVISIVFMPLNLLTGFFGMSEFTALTERFGWWAPYTAFSAALMLIGALTYWIMMRVGPETR